MKDFFRAAVQFDSNVVEVKEYGNGNINSTFLVSLDSCEDKKFIIQRINTSVFPQPELIMKNMRIISEHINGRLNVESIEIGRRWEMPQILLTREGQDHWVDQNSSFWRAISFIENSESFESINNPGLATEAGYALGLFHYLLSDLPVNKLSDTLKGFHITPLYLRHYNEVQGKGKVKKTPEVSYCMKFIEDRSTWAHVLENARSQNKLSNRTIHGDPKVNNILIDNNSGQAVSIVDLDTVKPGLIHYDIGDCLRSGCNVLGEETDSWEGVEFETDLCESILKGYHSIASQFLAKEDNDYIYDAARLLAFELGLRFFTDYLEGNVYFKTVHPEHNLQRALVQFKLTESIESRAELINAIIRDLK